MDDAFIMGLHNEGSASVQVQAYLKRFWLIHF